LANTAVSIGKPRDIATIDCRNSLEPTVPIF
jgi:hypothetical protein